MEDTRHHGGGRRGIALITCRWQVQDSSAGAHDWRLTASRRARTRPTPGAPGGHQVEEAVQAFCEGQTFVGVSPAQSANSPGIWKPSIKCVFVLHPTTCVLKRTLKQWPVSQLSDVTPSRCWFCPLRPPHGHLTFASFQKGFITSRNL